MVACKVLVGPIGETGASDTAKLSGTSFELAIPRRRGKPLAVQQ